VFLQPQSLHPWHTLNGHATCAMQDVKWKCVWGTNEALGLGIMLKPDFLLVVCT